MYRSHSYSPPKVSSTEPSIPPRQFRKEDGTESRKEALEEISVLKKASRGVRGIKLAKNEELEKLYLIGDNPVIDYKGKEVHMNRLKLAKRDGKGSKVRL